MKLKQIYINATNEWDLNPNTYCGSVTFESPTSEIKINLDNETAEEIVKLCASGIVRAAQETGGKILLALSNTRHEKDPIEGSAQND